MFYWGNDSFFALHSDGILDVHLRKNLVFAADVEHVSTFAIFGPLALSPKFSTVT